VDKITPSPKQVITLREKIQADKKMGITAAHDYCADMLFTSRRSWQQWERGERKMHPAFWKLAKIELAMLNEHS